MISNKLRASRRFSSRSVRWLQQGQSAVEFTVLALVLVPLFVVVPLLGKYIDISQHTIAASRYAAFEAVGRHSTAFSSWKSDEDLEQEARRRFFSASEAPVKTDDSAGDFTAHRNPVWTDPSGKPLIERFSRDVTLHAGQEEFNHPFGAFFADDLTLPQRNLHTATVTVRPVNLTSVRGFESLDLTIREHVVLLADPWWVRDGDMVTRKITGSSRAFPASAGIELSASTHKMLADAYNLTLAPIGVSERSPDVPRIEPNIVPSDRLGPYREEPR